MAPCPWWPAWFPSPVLSPHLLRVMWLRPLSTYLHGCAHGRQRRLFPLTHPFVRQGNLFSRCLAGFPQVLRPGGEGGWESEAGLPGSGAGQGRRGRQPWCLCPAPGKSPSFPMAPVPSSERSGDYAGRVVFRETPTDMFTGVPATVGCEVFGCHSRRSGSHQSSGHTWLSEPLGGEQSVGAKARSRKTRGGHRSPVKHGSA